MIFTEALLQKQYNILIFRGSVMWNHMIIAWRLEFFNYFAVITIPSVDCGYIPDLSDSSPPCPSTHHVHYYCLYWTQGNTRNAGVHVPSASNNNNNMEGLLLLLRVSISRTNSSRVRWFTLQQMVSLIIDWYEVHATVVGIGVVGAEYHI